MTHIMHALTHDSQYARFYTLLTACMLLHLFTIQFLMAYSMHGVTYDLQYACFFHMTSSMHSFTHYSQCACSYTWLTVCSSFIWLTSCLFFLMIHSMHVYILLTLCKYLRIKLFTAIYLVEQMYVACIYLCTYSNKSAGWGCLVTYMHTKAEWLNIMHTQTVWLTNMYTQAVWLTDMHTQAVWLTKHAHTSSVIN
jgi:hypothetical protein